MYWLTELLMPVDRGDLQILQVGIVHNGHDVVVLVYCFF